MKLIINSLLLITMFCFGLAVAQADDMDSDYGPFVPVGMPQKQNNLYLGVQGGYAESDTKVSSLEPLNFASTSISKGNATVGGYIGYRFSRYIAAEVGYEYFQGAKIQASGTNTAGVPFSVNKRPMTHTVNLVGRLNIPLVTYRFQVFVKGGGVFVDQESVSNNGVTVSSSKDDVDGIVIVGAEYFLTKGFTINAEYTHIFGSSSRSRTPAFDAVTGGFYYYFS
ncbi:MAG: outer membrane beta-barrel protein [Pseudomonadota bacterium]